MSLLRHLGHCLLFLKIRKEGNVKEEGKKGIGFDSTVYELWEGVLTVSVLEPKN